MSEGTRCQGGVRRCGRRWRSARVPVWAVMAVVLCACACVWCASAVGFVQRGHEFAFGFGSAGQGEGQFAGPAAVAVNESDGMVYVADRANNRVQIFSPVVGAAGQITGVSFAGELAVPAPTAVAVDSATAGSDPSAGDVYVVGATAGSVKRGEPEERIVYKFAPAGGTPLETLKRFKGTEEEGAESERFEDISGVAVTASGELLVYDEGLDVFNDAATNKGLFFVRTPGRPAPGLAVNSNGDVYFGRESENPEAFGPEGAPAVVGELDPSTGEQLAAELDQRPSTAVTVSTADVPSDGVDELGDVYVANVDRPGAEGASAVAAFSPGGSLIQRFTAPGLAEASGVAVDSRNGTVYVADRASDRIDVFELEPPGAPRVDHLSAGEPQPAVHALSAAVDPDGLETQAYLEYGTAACANDPGACARSTEAHLSGFGDQQLSDALGGLGAGVYHYRLIARNAAGSAVSPERTFTVISAEEGLLDGRGWEMVSPPLKDGAEPEALTREGGAVQAAADGAAFAFVADGPMPAGGEVSGSRSPEFTQILSVRTAQGWASQDISTPNAAATGILVGHTPEYQLFSSDLALALLQPFGGGANASPWAEPPLSPPVSQHEAQLAGEGETYQEKTIYERADQPIPPAPSEADTYETAQADGQIMGGAGFVSLVSEADALGVLGETREAAAFGGGQDEGIEVLDATSDLSHVVFKSYRANPGLYEWGPGSKLSRVSVLPGGGHPHGEATLGGPEGSDVSHAISSDGALVFWTLASGEEAHLYVTDAETGETAQLDTPAGDAGEGKPDADFQTASVDGSRVFFTDTQQLTASSRAEAHGSVPKPDLYVFELNRSPGLSGTLSDLTPEGIEGESADVVVAGAGHVLGGGVLGASEDGGYVYFVANAMLSEGATHGDCTTREGAAPGRHCNLYVVHRGANGWEAPELVGVLSNEDAPDWGGVGSPGDPAYQTARVSPDGRYLAFMSREPLTGYDNEDATSQHPGERVDEEVYLYDAQSEALTCVSCNPTGQRPHGVFDPGESGEGGAGEGLGLLVDRIGIWGAGDQKADHWLAGSIPGWSPIELKRALYQPRYLDDTGRLFFDSPDPLVPAATSAKEKVYEYEPGQTGSCQNAGGCLGLISPGDSTHEAAFLDASEDGQDAFFLTAAKLSPQDIDSNFDVYDARVCEPTSPCLPTPAPPAAECEGTAASPCQVPAAPGGDAPAPRTAGAFGPEPSPGVQVLGEHSNAGGKPEPLTRAQQLARALAACRRQHKAASRRRQRAKCEAGARKRFAPKKPTRGGKHTTKPGKR